MTHVIAICNQKGGVSKTTTCLSLGACLVEAGFPTLLVDLDPQANLSVASGVGIETEALSIGDLIQTVLDDEGYEINEAIQKTTYPGLDLLNADTGLAVIERGLFQRAGYETILKDILASAGSSYEYMIIDCSPSLGSLTVMALTAAQQVIIPVQCDYLSAWGVMRLIDTIDAVRNHTNPHLDYHLLVAMFDKRNNISREVFARYKERFGDHLFQTQIGVDTRLKESVINGQPVIAYAPKTRASLQYRTLAKEVINITPVGTEK